MTFSLMVNDIPIAVTRKAIKNLHLAVYPPAGEVRVSAPLWMSDERIRLFARSRLDWLQKQISSIQGQARESRREYLNMETHYVWGEPRLLRIVSGSARQHVELDHATLRVYAKGSPTPAKLHAILVGWYRGLVYAAALPVIEDWRQRLGVARAALAVRQMKARWGTCYPGRGRITLNTELAKKYPECLEYVVVHELAHFLVPNHGRDFVAIMDAHLPDWRITRKKLNLLPAAFAGRPGAKTD